MKCLSKGRTDIVVILRGEKSEHLWAIYNMTPNKLTLSTMNSMFESKTQDYFLDCLTNEEIYGNNFVLDPYDVKWLKEKNYD